MISVTINLCQEHHEPRVKVLRNNHGTPAQHFSVLEIGEASVILPGYDRGSVAFMYALSAELELSAQELETALAAEIPVSAS